MPNPFAHIELSTDDVAGAKKFYKNVFDWKVVDMPEMSYSMIDVGKGTGGGITVKNMPGQPTAWLPYVEVVDVKRTMAKVVKGGGQVMVEYQEIGEMGAIGVFVDPTGAAIGVWEMAKKPAKKATKKKAAAKKPAAKKPAAKKKGARR